VGNLTQLNFLKPHYLQNRAVFILAHQLRINNQVFKKRRNKMKREMKNLTGGWMVKVVLVVLVGMSAMLTTGCVPAGLAGNAYDLMSMFPEYGLYDPTADIQSVIDYRQDVMDWSNDAWDEYIRQ
jgi:hypothetical protein